jgi:hypothetical protein
MGSCTGSIFESSASDAHGVPPSSLFVVGPSPHQGRPNCPTKKGPLPKSTTALSSRQDGTKVPYTCRLLAAIPIHRSKVQRASYSGFLILTPLSFSPRPVSNYSTRLLAPARVSRLTKGNEPLTQNGSCCLPTCIFTTLSSPLLFHKAERSTCIPGCAFLVSTEALQFDPRPIYSLRATTSRVPHTVKQELVSTPIIVRYGFGRQPRSKPYLRTLYGCEIQTCTRVITQTACLQSPEGPPQLLFRTINLIPSPTRRRIASLPASKQSSGHYTP